MSVVSNTIQWAGNNPIKTAAIVIGGGLGILWLGGAFSRRAPVDNTGPSLAQTYYMAEGIAAATGNELAAIQAQMTAATAIAQIEADAAQSIIARQEEGATSRLSYAAEVAMHTAGLERDVALAAVSAQTDVMQHRITAERDSILWSGLISLLPEQLQPNRTTEIDFRPGEGIFRAVTTGTGVLSTPSPTTSSPAPSTPSGHSGWIAGVFDPYLNTMYWGDPMAAHRMASGMGEGF